MERSKKDTALVFLCYEDLREIEWIVPTCLAFFSKSVFVTPFETKNDRTQLIKPFFSEFNSYFTTYLGLATQGTMLQENRSHLAQKIHSFFYRSLLKCQFGWISRFQVDLFFLFLSRKHSLQNVTSVYFGRIFLKQKETYFILKFFQFMKDNSIHCAMFPTNYRGAIETEIKFGNITFPLTAQLHPRGSFEQNKFRTWFEYFGSTTEWQKIFSRAGQKPIAVFFTKNFSNVGNKFPAEMRKNSRKKIIDHLTKNGFFVVIKPHPGEGAIKEKIKHNTSYTHLPSTFLCTKVNATVFELPTNSIFDAVANGKTPFLPLDLYRSGEFTDTNDILMSFSEFMRIAINQFCSLKLPENNDDLDIPENVMKTFYENYVSIR